MKIILRLAFSCMALAALAAVCSGQDDSFPPSIESPWIEWKGMCRMPGFVKYHLTVRTSGDAFDGVIKIRAGALYTADMQIPVASTRDIAIPVLISSPSVVPTVSLETRKGREILAQQPLPKPVPLTAGRIVAGLIALESTPEWFDPSRFDKNIVTVPMWASEAPVVFEDMEPADLMVLDCNANISEEAAAATLRWVESGGFLVLPNLDPAESGQFNRSLLAKLFHERVHGRAILPEGVLEKWGAWDFRTVSLETLRATRGVRSPLSENGWVSLSRRGRGGIVILTGDSPKRLQADDARLAAVWRIILDEMAGFQSSSTPPNPERIVARIATVEPRLHRFFEKISWPDDILARAETGITIYAAIAVFALAASGLLFFRKRMHFAVAAAAGVAGILMLTIGFLPKRTAVGETLDIIESKNASSAAIQSKLLHVASFTGSTVNCRFQHKDGDRLYSVAYSPDELTSSGPVWHFGEKTEIRDIRLDEGSRFLALASRSRFDLGSVAVRRTGGAFEIENAFKHTLFAGAVLMDGRFLPVGDMKFGDLPRRVDDKTGWISLAEYLEALKKLRDPSAARVLKAYFDQYYSQGREVFVAFFTDRSPGFTSEDLIWKKEGMSFLYIELSDAAN